MRMVLTTFGPMDQKLGDGKMISGGDGKVISQLGCAAAGDMGARNLLPNCYATLGVSC